MTGRQLTPLHFLLWCEECLLGLIPLPVLAPSVAQTNLPLKQLLLVLRGQSLEAPHIVKVLVGVGFTVVRAQIASFQGQELAFVRLNRVEVALVLFGVLERLVVR